MTWRMKRVKHCLDQGVPAHPVLMTAITGLNFYTVRACLMKLQAPVPTGAEMFARVALLLKMGVKVGIK
jgi:hypothetical protein